MDRNRAELEIVGEQAVALRKESVDRNRSGGAEKVGVESRSPQGERG